MRELDEPVIPPLPSGVRESNAAWEAWGCVAAALRYDLPEFTYEIWFGDLELAGEANGALCLQGPPRLVTWLHRRYGLLVGRLVRELTGYRGAFIANADEISDEDGCL